MPLRIFVNVIGFSDVERHALNTVFRLSQERDTHYALWQQDAPEAAQLTLVDGRSEHASDWLGLLPENHQGELFWVGPVAPARAARVFDRPLHWPDVVRAMDELFAPPTALDFDLDLGQATQAFNLELVAKRALVVDTDRDSRLYFRAKLSSAGIHSMDDAISAAQALALLRGHAYDLVVIDSRLPDTDMDVWALVAAIRSMKPAVRMVLVVAEQASPWLRLRGRLAGARAVLQKPPHPGKLHDLLQKI